MHSTIPHIVLNIIQIVEYGHTIHGRTPVASWSGNGPETTTFSTIAARASALTHALRDELGIDGDQCVAILVYDYIEHFEVSLGVASMDTVFQPLNKQLIPDQVVYIINHADDQVIIADPTEIELLTEVLPHCPRARAIIIIGTDDLSDVVEQLLDGIPWCSYESLIGGRSSRSDRPELGENSGATMCYSMGTESAPKGVVYNHRSLYLHSLNICTIDSFAIPHGSPWLYRMPIYHVLSQGVPLASLMYGASLIFPGADLSAPRLAEIIETSMPRVAQGVPTLWINLMAHYLSNLPKRISLREILSGGFPVLPALIRLWEECYGVGVIHL